MFTNQLCYASNYEKLPMADDIFKTTKEGTMLVTSLLFNKSQTMLTALTAPTANRDYDYERLEFFGDSVISFLVILELFLMKDHKFKEGDLDHYRIKTVSNMNFNKINRKNKIY